MGGSQEPAYLRSNGLVPPKTVCRGPLQSIAAAMMGVRDVIKLKCG